METKKDIPVGGSKFGKGELLKADRYRGKEDLLEALLTPDTQYTFKEVDSILDRFLNRKVR